MCHWSWPHRSPSVGDGGLRLLDPFHSLFLPLGLSPAFFVPKYWLGTVSQCQEPPESMCRPRLCLAAHLLFSTCWFPPASTVPGFITLLAFCLHSLFPWCLPNTHLCLGPWGYPTLPSPSGLSHSYLCFPGCLPSLSPHLRLTRSICCPLALPPGPHIIVSPQLSVTLVASSLPVLVGQSLAGSSSPMGLVSRG